ncbi:MAG: serine hydrolase domain-containing protein [Acidobacteriota bacterium]
MAMRAFLDSLLSTGTASVAAAVVGTADGILWEGEAGAAPETRFDYASLTKPITATLALALDAEGTLPLSARVGEVWSEAHPELAKRTMADLLRHRSGLVGWAPFYHLCRSREEALSLILGGELLRDSRKPVYSDPDFILYGMSAERVTGETLARLIRSRIFDPLEMTSVEPAPGDRPDVAASRMDTGKEVELAARMGIAVPLQGPPPAGMPQDGNARFLISSGLTAHAGLFGTARDLWKLGAEWAEPRRLLKPEAAAKAVTGRPFLLGWWRRTLRGSAGPALPPGSFGHTGFAGGSLWIDPAQQRVYVLLTHRTSPDTDFNRQRRRFHALAAAI